MTHVAHETIIDAINARAAEQAVRDNAIIGLLEAIVRALESLARAFEVLTKDKK